MLVVVGFTAVMGANMYYVDVTQDSARYASRFMEDTTYGVDLEDFISRGRIDILYPLSNVLLGCFTQNPRILFTLYGLLAGLFIFLSLSKINDILKGYSLMGDNKPYRFQIENNGIVVMFILIMIYFVNPITQMPTFRFYFSGWVFFYGWLIFTLEKNRNGLIFMLITPLIHTTFILPIIIFFVHKIVKLPTKTLFGVVIFSFVIGQIVYLQDYMQDISFIAESEKYEVYIQEEEYEERMEMAEHRSIINAIYQIAYRYVFFFIILYSYSIINRIKKTTENVDVVNLYNFILLYFGFAYLFAEVPSMGRFLGLGNRLLLFFIGILFVKGFLRQKRVIFILILLAMLGNIYISIFPKNINIFDLRYLYPIFYL